ncbi:MAG: TlpA family protein disulfide reductase [Rubrobacteraceae bacterium]
MKRLFLVGFLVLILAVGWRSYGSPETGTGSLTLPQPAPNEGEQAPEFSAQTLKGEGFRIEDDGVYVLTFWSTLNQGSYKAKAGFSKLAEEYPDDEVSFGAVYVSNTPGDYGEVPYDVIRDSNGRLTSLYNVKRVPRLFLIKDGRILAVQNNHYEENEKLLRDELEEITAEEPS